MGKGTVGKELRAQGLTWVYRYRCIRPSDGRTVENKKAIGLVKKIGSSDADVWRELGRLGLDKNIDQVEPRQTDVS